MEFKIIDQLDFENENQFIKEDRTFFCTGLIAKAFKILGVI